MEMQPGSLANSRAKAKGKREKNFGRKLTRKKIGAAPKGGGRVDVPAV